MSQDAHIAKCVAQWLQQAISRSTDSDATDSMQIALQCLEAAFHFESSSLPADLPDLSSLIPHPEEDKPDPRFERFLAIFEGNGFFNGLEKGTPQYEDRMRLARSHYEANAKKEAQTQPKQPVPNKEAADACRLKGNEAIKAKKYEEAVAHYTEGISHDGTNAVLFCNRAAAYLQLGKAKESAEDCKKAISLDPKYVKAYTRLGAALKELGQYEDAEKMGYDKALELDPDNEAAKEGKEALKALNGEKEAKAPPMPDMSKLGEMMKDPAFMQTATQIGQQLFGGNGAEQGSETKPAEEGAGAAPGGNGPQQSSGGNPLEGVDMAQLMNNPMLQGMMNSPMFQGMLQNVMSNPELMNSIASMASSMFGGAPQQPQPQQPQQPQKDEEKKDEESGDGQA